MPFDTTSRFVPLSAPEISGNEWKYVRECLDSGWVSSSGPLVERFERAVAEAVTTAHAVATVNGTAALHVALLGAGVEPEDEVIVPALSFVATANAVRYCGAHPVFVDVDAATWGIDASKVADFLDRECAWDGQRLTDRTTGRRVRALLPVHLLGHPVDADPLLTAARRYGLAVIEDACEALGAHYRDRAVGRLGDAGCFSFNGNKVVTAGGGGVVVTDDEALARRVRHLTLQAREPGGEYVHDAVGFNYRLTNVCAAVGLAQIERLAEFLKRKRRIAERYRRSFVDFPAVQCMPVAPWASPSHWLFTIRLRGPASGTSADLVARLQEAGIEARRLWRPLHLLPMYYEARRGRLDEAEAVYQDAVSLPSSVGLAPGDQDHVIDHVLRFVSEALRR